MCNGLDPGPDAPRLKIPEGGDFPYSLPGEYLLEVNGVFRYLAGGLKHFFIFILTWENDPI